MVLVVLINDFYLELSRGFFVLLIINFLYNDFEVYLGIMNKNFCWIDYKYMFLFKMGSFL